MRDKLCEDRSHGEHGERFSASLDQHRNRAVTQRQYVQRLLFCMLHQHRRRLVEACIFSRFLAVRALCALSESVNFCFVSSVALAIRPWRSKDRLPLARGDVGLVTLIEIALLVPSLLVLASPATKNLAQMGVGHDSSNSSAQGRKKNH